jgi:hypothetical protein
MAAEPGDCAGTFTIGDVAVPANQQMDNDFGGPCKSRLAVANLGWVTR